MSAWTPGPWVPTWNGFYWEIKSERDAQIADTCASNIIYWSLEKIPSADAAKIAEANARLISASPSLYDFVAKRAAEGDEDAAALIASI
jgi:hypothetical protein